MAAKYAPRHATTRDWTGFRLVFVGVLFGLCWLALWGRAFQVQVLMGDKLSAMASRQHVASEFVSGERGRIFDNRGRLLAKSVQSHSVYARPMDVEDPAHTARELGRLFGVSAKTLEKNLRSTRPFVWVSRQVGDRAASKAEALALPGVHLVDEFKRTYPNGHLLGQLLGFTGLDGNGLEGLERSLDETLRGHREKNVVQRDASGQVLYENGVVQGEDSRGQDVHLTIDAEIQAVAEQALERSVTRYKGDNGTALVVETATGKILAWAQYPFFNPNIYRRYKPVTWRNRVALDAMEPGSTMKPFTIAAALQAGVVTPSTKFFCEQGKFEMRGAVIRDTHEYDDLNVSHILRYSSNIGAAKIGMKLGAQGLYDSLKKLGFGERPQLPLPGESRGILRDPGAWQKVDLANIAFGQGVAATPLQMARAYLCLARGGTMLPLRLVQDEKDASAQGVKVFSTEVARSVLSMMQDVVMEDGTGTQARIAGISVGGKTGTAQKASPLGGYGEDHVASFVGLIPAMEPEYLVLVMVDRPHPQHYGGVVAAPAVKEIAVQSLAYLGKLPESSIAQVPQANRTRSSENEPVLVSSLGSVAGSGNHAGNQHATKAVPDVVGLSLRRAVEVFAHGGALPEIRGQGVVVGRQQPSAGQPWPKTGQGCVLWLSQPSGRI